MWADVGYPSLMRLASSVVDLEERLATVGGWIAKGHPAVYWISGFFFPQVKVLRGQLVPCIRRPDLWRLLPR
jgi:hypothetical protein